MKTRNIIPVAMLLGLIFMAIAVNARIFWPGEKWFEGITNVDGLKSVFEQHTSNYDRRYLIQALPYFCKDHQINVLPRWLVEEIGSAIDDNDPLLVKEGVIAARTLNLSELSPNLARTYIRARQLSFEDMPLLHTNTVAALGQFNNANSRKALADIVNTPQPTEIVTDVVPALRVLTVTGDNSCFAALDGLADRVKRMKDSIVLLNSGRSGMMVANADSLKVKADSIRDARIIGMADLVVRVKNKIKERTGAK